MIPDSPTSRGPRSISEDFGTTIDVHRESTKSESPELDPPIHDMALTNSSSPAGEQVDRGVYEVEPEIPPDVSSTIVQTDRQSHPASSLTVLVDAGATPNSTLIQHSMDASSVVDNEKRRHQTEHVGNTQTPFKRKTPSKDITPGEQAINGINGDIYDPIESDSESFQEKQRMHSAKRLKNSNTNRGHFVAPCVPPSRGKERKDDGFVVPSLPASRDHRARLPLLTNANPGGDGTNIQDNGQVLEAHQRSSVTTAEGSQSSENVTITEKVAGQEDASAGRATAKIDDRSRTTSNPHGSSTQEAGRLAADDLAVGKKRRPAQPKLEEDELGNIRRTTDGSKEMKQAAEQKKMEEILARGRQTREKALAEEAKKIMLAADGARHLEAEKIEKKRMNGKPDKEVAAPTETSPKVLRIAETKSSEMLPSTSNKTISREMSVNDSASKRPLPIESTSHNIPGSNGAALTAHTVTRYKARTEEQKARRIELAAQKKAAEARAAERRNSSDGMTMREQDMPILERCVQKFRALSDDTSGHSSTPSEPASICGQKRKTMTPALPKSSVNTPSSNKNGVLSSSPMSSKSLNGQETPLRSALKQGSSALRRSVSFVDDPEDHLPGSKASIFLSPPMTHHIDIGSRPVQTSTDIDNELSFKTPNKSNPLKPAMPWKGSGSKASETNSVKKGKLQTKLNVTRHVAKGKEREIDAPVVREHPPPQVKQKSSPSDDDSVSSFLSDEAVGPDGSSKAGPSSRMSRGRMEPLRKKAAAADALPDSLIDPEFHNITVGKDKALTPVPASTSLPEQKSKTRSPALPLPEQTSPDFGSTSNSEEGWHCDSDDTSGSSSEQSDSLSSADEVENQSSNQARVGIEGARKAVSVEIRSPSITSKSQPSQISSTPSSKSRNPPPNDGGTRLADQVAKEQLRSESHQSLPTPKAGNKATCEVSAQEKPASIPNQKLDRHGRLPNGIRPANYRYPSLSQLRRQSKAESVFGVPSTSQAPATTSVGEGAVASHSSEDESSEDESSNSEDDKAAKNGQPKLKSTSGRIPGLRGLIKRT